MVRATKSLIFHENYFTTFWEIGQENGPLAEKLQTERARGLGRKTREEIRKENQMTALRFQTGEWHQISQASLRWDSSDSRVRFSAGAAEEIASPGSTFCADLFRYPFHSCVTVVIHKIYWSFCPKC